MQSSQDAWEGVLSSEQRVVCPLRLVLLLKLLLLRCDLVAAALSTFPYAEPSLV